MSEKEPLLSAAERAALEQLAQEVDAGLEGQRAQALLAIDAGQTQAEAAAAAGLSTGQLSYFLGKFREDRLGAFAADTAVGAVAVPEDVTQELRDVINDLSDLLLQLQALLPEAARQGMTSTYSPQGIVVLIRENVDRLTPDIQLDMLRNLQGMSAEDLMDIDTWKGMGYMMTYSARFQATQALDKVTGVVDQVVPAAVHPRRFWNFAMRSADRVTPEFVKQLAATFKDATVSDLVDPDTWKGLWTMFSYSLQFQAEQMRDRLIEMENERQAS